MAVHYEWVIEELDWYEGCEDDPDIIDHYRSDKLKTIGWRFGDLNRNRRLCLYRVKNNGFDIDNQGWAYISEEGKLPEIMTDALGRWEANTPKKFIKEFESWKNNF